MKRRFFLLALVLVAVSATAQISYGARLGAGLNKVSKMSLPTAGDLSYKTILAPTVGVMVSLPACEWLDVQAELNYAMRGYSDRVQIAESQESAADYKVRASYIELPLLAKVYPFKQNAISLQAGPQVGYQFGRSVSVSDNRLEKDWLVSAARKVDCALVFGVGDELGNWCVDLRYTLGLVKTFKDWPGRRNLGLSVSVGYYLK